MDMLGPFIFHGVQFSDIPEQGQATGDCLFCGKDNHFYVNPETGQWDCKRCGENGNIVNFLGKILDLWLPRTTKADYLRLKDLRRNVCHSDEFRRSRFVWDGYRWLFPCCTVRGTICDLRTYIEGKRIIGTKGCTTGLWGSEQLLEGGGNKTKPVWICEGEWDGIAARYLLRRLGKRDAVVAVPGGTVFKREWADLLQGRPLNVVYDADKTGDNGMLKVKKLMAHRVPSLKFIRWPLDIRDGYDISDLIVDEGDKAYDKMIAMLSEAPRTESLIKEKTRLHIKKATRTLVGAEEVRIPTTGNTSPIKSFEEVVTRFRRWFEMSDDAVTALRIIFTVIFSNALSGDPLWFYIVAPPGSGKTALLNPLRSVPELCVFRSSLTTHMLVSGFQSNQDPSLIPSLFGKTLVLKDMTEILSAPQHVQEEVFSTLRGAYDGLVERSYGNAVYRKYEGMFSFLAGVTVQIHGHSRASMGERMLKYQLIPYGHRDHESQIRAAMRNTGKEDELDADLFAAVSGFLSRDIDIDKIINGLPTWAEDRIVGLAQLIAMLRTEVERDYRGEMIKYRPQDEVATRLGKQLKKLAMLLPLTNDTKNMEFLESDFDVVERVAFDTAIGWSLDVVQAMMSFNNGLQPVSARELIEISKLPRSNISRKLEDLTMLKVVERTVDKTAARNEDRVFYKLSKPIRSLWAMAKVKSRHVERTMLVARGRKIKIRKGARKP